MKNARKTILEKRQQLSHSDKAACDKIINANIYKLFSEDFHRSKAVLCYYPLKDEVNLIDTYEELLSDGYALFFPKTYPDGSMEFYRVKDLLTQLTEGAFHVMEPVDFSEKYDYSTYEYNQTFMIAPGLIFDESCHRMGFGKGFYDRFLSDKNGIIKCAVAYDFQILPEIPMNPWDVPMDIIITPERTFYRAVML